MPQVRNLGIELGLTPKRAFQTSVLGIRHLELKSASTHLALNHSLRIWLDTGYESEEDEERACLVVDGLEIDHHRREL